MVGGREEITESQLHVLRSLSEVLSRGSFDLTQLPLSRGAEVPYIYVICSGNIRC